MATPLTEEQIQTALEKLPGWAYENNRISKTFRFNGFRESISFIVRLAFYAEELNHHPELRNVYNRVTISLTTHDAGDKLTDLDIELASAIEHFAWV